MGKYELTPRIIEDDAPVWTKRIIGELNKKKTTQAELAKMSGVSEGTISGWFGGGENKKTKHYTEPKIESLVNVAKALNVSLDYLAGLSDTKSVDDNIKIACKTTKLSEKTIHGLVGLIFPYSEINGKSPSETKYINKDVIDALLQSDGFTSMVTALRGATDVPENFVIGYDNYTGLANSYMRSEADLWGYGQGDTFSVRDVYNLNYSRAAQHAYESVVNTVVETEMQKMRPTGFKVIDGKAEPLQPLFPTHPKEWEKK